MKSCSLETFSNLEFIKSIKITPSQWTVKDKLFIIQTMVGIEKFKKEMLNLTIWLFNFSALPESVHSHMMFTCCICTLIHLFQVCPRSKHGQTCGG